MTALRDDVRPASVVLGEAGIGKSRLLAEARRRSEDDVFYVACLPNAMLLPLEPLMALVQKMYRHGRIDHGQAQRAIAAKESDRLWYAREAFEAALSSGLLTVQVDDVQWAGAESLEALSYCIHRLQDLPLRWQLACRCGVAAGEELAFRLVKAGLATVHRIEGFSAAELRAFAAAVEPERDFDEQTLAALQAQTAGNPLYAQLLLAAGFDKQGSIPRDLRRALQDRLGELTANATRIAAWLAVDGGCLSAATLAEVSRQSPTDLGRGLDELVDACIFKHSADGYSFRNALLRDACYETLDENTRAGCHEALAAGNQDQWERALHLQAARRYGEAASQFAKMAWERLDGHAPTEALTAFSRCLECAEPESDVRWEARAGIAAALYGLGKAHEARRAMAGFEATAEALPAQLRALARARFAEAAWDSTQDPAAALPSLELAMREAPSAAPELLPRLLYVLAAVHERRGNLNEAQAALERGIAACNAQSHVREPIRLRGWLGVVLGRLGKVSDGIAIVESAADQASALQLGDEFANCCTKLCYLYDMLEDHQKFEQWCRCGLEVPGPKSKSVQAVLMSNLAEVAANKGRLREALGLTLAAAEKIDENNGAFLCQALCLQAFLYAMLGDQQNTERVLNDAGESNVQDSWNGALQFTAGYAAELHEDYEKALGFYASAAAAVVPHRSYEVYELRALVGTIRVAWALRRRDPALRAFESLRYAESEGWSVAGHLLHQAEGYVKLIEDDVSTACEKLLLAAEADQDPFSKAQLLLAVADARGDRELFTSVIESFDSMEAVKAADRARQLARAHGFRPGRHRHAEGALSARENSVALLVANGKTNKEIGTLLHISGRTVEYHIANILTKCGLRSRVEIATRIAAGVALEEAG
ncbi:MAG: LuxR C-terminal-related transcriptional regulator [Candidatus Eremiobacteraeota bacterium]|nr:LuxR C-terminal-related transcriptional regulator [Candidatus Eremiobacteraeota bacterium]